MITVFCATSIHNHEFKQSGASGWKTIEEKTKVWVKINVPEDDAKYRQFTEDVKRFTRLKIEKKKLMCFVCNTHTQKKKTADSKPYS